MRSRKDFEQLLGSATKAWNCQDYLGALEILNRIPATARADWMSQVLYFSGLIKRDAGDFVESLQDLEKGLALSDEKSFLRYCFQVAIGEHFELTRDGEKALRWYREAILSNVNGNDYSANKALSNFLRLCGENIPPRDVKAVQKALVKSWDVLGLPDKPDLLDIPASIARLESGFANQLDDIING